MQAGPFGIDAVYKHVLHAAHLGLEPFPAYFLLQFHDQRPALLLHTVLHLVGQGGSDSSFLGPEGKNPKLGKAHALYKIVQMLKVLVRFPGVAHNKGCAQSRIRQGLAYGFEHALGLYGKGPAHAAQDIGMAVLQGNVKIGQKGIHVLHCLQKFPCYPLRIEVEHAQPGYAVDVSEPAQKMGKGTGVVSEIVGIVAEILGNEHNLPGPLVCQHMRLTQKFLHGSGVQGTTDGGNGAKGTAVPAALGNLQVGVGRRSGHKTSRRCCTPTKGGKNHCPPVLPGCRLKPQIHLWQAIGKTVPAVTPDQAAGNAQKSLFPFFGEVKNGAHGFPDCRLYEAAGVHKDKIRF